MKIQTVFSENIQDLTNIPEEYISEKIDELNKHPANAWR
jgi:hypothetical protein